MRPGPGSWCASTPTHPRLREAGSWHGAGRTETGSLREQIMTRDPAEAQPDPDRAVTWRRIELTLTRPTHQPWPRAC